jgi:hypothetical protein
MLPDDAAGLETAARHVRDRLTAHRAGRFQPPPATPRARGRARGQSR